MKEPQTVSWRIKLIGFGVRLVSFLLETFPGLPRHWWPPASPVTLLAQTLISSGVLFIMINAEMINGNANDGEVPQPSALNIIITSPLLNRSLSSPMPVFSGAHGCQPERLPEHDRPDLVGFSSPYAFIHLLLNICLATRVPIYFQLRW